MIAKRCIKPFFSALGLCLLAATYCFTVYADQTAEDNSISIGHLCTLGGAVRRVEVYYPQAPETLPCQVIYYKDTEAPDQPEVLWDAQNEDGYCEAKANDMAEDLETKWGWQCTPQ